MFETLSTPALLIESAPFEANLAAMAAAWPGSTLRPHVKAHKCTAIARRQLAAGHRGFTCATPGEVVGMARAGIGDELLLANETLDPARLRAMAEAREHAGVGVIVALDSVETLEAGCRGGITDVVIDVNVGLPRCGCRPGDAGRLADMARTRGLTVRGVMGYEGHLMMVVDPGERRARVERSMTELRRAFADVGGEIVSAGGTGTFDVHRRSGPTAITELQAGSYALLDTAYATLDAPFAPALSVLGTVVSVQPGWAVADVGLKALGMDHGNPSIDDAEVLFCSDEHITFRQAATAPRLRPGDRVRVLPAHLDPTMVLHESAWLVDDDRVIDHWPIDLRGW